MAERDPVSETSCLKKPKLVDNVKNNSTRLHDNICDALPFLEIKYSGLAGFRLGQKTRIN
jgi:hypothetical protein